MFKPLLELRNIIFWVGILLALSATPVGAKTTPSDVYAKLELAEQHANQLLLARNISFSEIKTIENGLKPMHVYQMLMACSDMIRTIQLEGNIRPFPMLAAAPMKYLPADVLLLAEVLEDQLERVVIHHQLDPSASLYRYQDKNPTDVFEKGLNLFVKLLKLSGAKNISPNVAYAQMARAVTDAEYILVNIDAYSRYQYEVPQSEAGLKPTDVFKKSLELRETLNSVRNFYQLGKIPIPAFDGKNKTPQDVFVQSQIIIAELNIIKLATKTQNITPVPIPVTGKTPSDVFQKVDQIDYLMQQIPSLTAIVADSKGN